MTRRLPQRMVKAASEVLTYPFRYLPEGGGKQAVRRGVLALQHRLPRPLLVNRGDTVVQVGTPHPRTLRRYSALVGATGRVVVVEADAENVRILRRALPSLRHQNTTIVARGAFSRPGTVTFYRSPISSDHRIAVPGVVHDNDYRPENAAYTEQRIEVDTLDHLLEGIQVSRVDVLVVTVNGAEVAVLEGAHATLRANSVRVFAKGHALSEDGQPLHHAICRLLGELGYTTVLSRGEPAVGTNPAWRMRAGDVYAYRA